MFLNEYLFEYRFSVLFWYIYLGVELLNHVVILYLIFLRNHQTLFQSSYSILHSPQQCTRVSISPEPLQYLFSAFLEYGYPRGCEVVSPCDFHWQSPPPRPHLISFFAVFIKWIFSLVPLLPVWAGRCRWAFSCTG